MGEGQSLLRRTRGAAAPVSYVEIYSPAIRDDTFSFVVPAAER